MNQPVPDLSWILNELVSLPEARHAVLLSADGLRTAASDGVDLDMADQVAALASGMQSLSRNGARFVNGDDPTPWQQTLVSFQAGYLVISSAGDGSSYLVVSAGKAVDMEVLSDQIAKTVQRLGSELAVAPREPRAEGA